MKSKRYLFFEFLILFCLGPLVLYGFRYSVGHKIVAVILLVSSGGLVYLIKSPKFNPDVFWRTAQWRNHLRNAAMVFAVGAPLLAAITYLYLPERFIVFPRSKPAVWLMVLVFYPLIAAYPQEIIFRAFFFERYALLFPRPAMMIGVNAVCFGLAHLFYGNWVAPILSALGGVLFGYRYLRSGSLLVVGLEHGLWGNYLFTIGIGWYFYSGSIQ